MHFAPCTCRVLKDTPIFIPILSLNRSKKLSGEDAYEFK